MKIVGVDLAASEKNPTGICVFEDWRTRCITVKSDEEIVESIQKEAPDLVVVDAPLGTSEGPWRDGEEALIKRGKRPLPLTMESMRALAERAERLRKRWKVKTIETFPSAFRPKILDVKMVRKVLGIHNRHERDALLCALVGRRYYHGGIQKLGKEHPIYIITEEAAKKDALKIYENMKGEKEGQ
ncbi:MAG: uncharacterized protein PWP76_700 [Candidatus Diapherotrites archaeon]|nr:uncharacterized protein [Candidatus Diapherotrites archaeon]